MSIEIVNNEDKEAEAGLQNTEVVKEIKIENGVKIVYLNSAPEKEETVTKE